MKYGSKNGPVIGNAKYYSNDEITWLLTGKKPTIERRNSIIIKTMISLYGTLILISGLGMAIS